MRQALTRVRLQIETDRSQITRMGSATAASGGLMLWQKSIETHDNTLAAIERLEAFVIDDRD